MREQRQEPRMASDLAGFLICGLGWIRPPFLFCPPKMLTKPVKCPFKTKKNFSQLCYCVNMNSHRAQLTLLESTLPRASSLMELVTPSCRTKSTGLTTPDLEQGTLTTIIRTFFKSSSVGRASRKLSSCKATSAFVVKVKILSNLHVYLPSAKAPSLGNLSNDDGDGNENGKKAIGLDWQNNNFARDITLFCIFLSHIARVQRESPEELRK